MGLRNIITIDEELCDGCGICTDACPEGALKIIDGKARLVSEIYCDGLGECIGNCPRNAIKVEKKEAEEYNEHRVMENIIQKGENTIAEHLAHLKGHGEIKYYDQAVEFLKKKGIEVPEHEIKQTCGTGCPSSVSTQIKKDESAGCDSIVSSHLSMWPVQLKLVSPAASFFNNADLLIAADCTAFAYGDIQNRFIRGRVPLVFCPKLDSASDMYIQKLAEIIKQNNIRSITLVRMEVPCCGGTSHILEEAIKSSGKVMSYREYIISLSGDIK